MMKIQTNKSSWKTRSSLAESILASIADAVDLCDDAGTIRRLERAAADLFGYGPRRRFVRVST